MLFFNWRYKVITEMNQHFYRNNVLTMCNFIVSWRGLHTVRVRFAPSPTGYLHLGGLRTSLYNYLFAKKHNGRFILRIEDTDQTRLVNDATSSLIEDLNWLGIKVDEGPEYGGNHGPYIQSQRLHIYNDNVQMLLKTKAAYRCFCTETRLNMLRKNAFKQSQIPRYDNKCRHISSDEIKQKLHNGIPFCIRFKIDNFSDPVKDLIYGNIFINVANEGDPVIIKSDGFPTYHFASVVDDHSMKITHVFRGVEWQTSTPKHLLLYKAFGWNPPEYGHLPLLINSDGTKLSKRQGDISVKNFRDRGIFPLALINYAMSAGGGLQVQPSEKPRIHTIENLLDKFEIESINSHPSRLNPDLLDEFNNMEIRRKLLDSNETDRLIEIVRSAVVSKYPQRNFILKTSYIRKILSWSADRLSSLSDLTSERFAFFWQDCDIVFTDQLTKDQVKNLIDNLESLEFSRENINRTLKMYSSKISIKFSDLMKILRSTLSGLKDGPGVAEIMCIFGKEESLRRIRSNLKTKM